MATWLGRAHVHLAVCDSTNDEAQTRAQAGAAHGTVITADAQRAGRGRLGRAWHSPAGESLYLSCILRPEMAPAQAAAVTLAAGLGVADAVAALGVAAELKWPNDVRVAGRKLAGILCEMSSRGHAVSHLVVGIGVNLGNRAFPDELAEIATSLALLGIDTSTGAFLPLLLEHLERWFGRFFTAGVAGLREPWMARAERTRVRASVAGRSVEGVVAGLDDSGCLLIEADGIRHRVLAGDVVAVPG
ncbi:biotin--[acetyl-CoA-carboxylase] ligase [Haliangium ochraceum]|uniref:biotin--[biotin carboxyl-carrier protein] ligase n=1 Tax=Haliangium ochraceum (strain DSM 14365 / JCM 11303 / SMP-2) TaxID=502025 RepID=D0LK00_HALO1|nr:biotin--[acetyl-CoA-carboxylase] ligase [Haliangium ochraceum]ACY18507.1 biotin/acetyl-CoA-carboxylase ligase [Haliangium ochraceum DSM 14365]